MPRAAVVVEDRCGNLLKHAYASAGFPPDMLARVQISYPEIPIVFLQTRPLAEEWNFRYLGAILAEFESQRQTGPKLRAAEVPLDHAAVEQPPTRRVYDGAGWGKHRRVAGRNARELYGSRRNRRFRYALYRSYVLLRSTPMEPISHPIRAWVPLTKAQRIEDVTYESPALPLSYSAGAPSLPSTILVDNGGL
jgi:hypothetical protein